MHRLARTALTAGVAAVAAVTVSSAPAQAASCTSDLCLYSGLNYTGTKSTAGYFGKNTHCYFDTRANSLISNTGYSIRMYNDKNCKGPSFVLKPGQKIKDTKFVVYSFKRV